MIAKRFLAMVLAGTMVLSSLEVAAADTAGAQGTLDEVQVTAEAPAADSSESDTEEEPTITVYFDNFGLWDVVYAYSVDADWNVLGSAWPGDEMTLVDSGLYEGWYVIEMDADTHYVTFADHSTGSQTGNIELEETSETYWITYSGSTVYTTSPVITLDDLEVGDWWTAFSEGMSLSVGQTLTITGTSTNNGDADSLYYNWYNGVFVLYNSDDDNVYAAGSDEGAAQNYTEYFVGRLDNYGWGTADYIAILAPDDWDDWLAESKNGIDFTLTATYSADGNIKISSECGVL